MCLCTCKNSSAVGKDLTGILCIRWFFKKKSLTGSILRVDAWCIWILTFLMLFIIFSVNRISQVCAFPPCYLNRWIPVFSCLVLTMWEFQTLCNKSNVTVSGKTRSVHLTKKKNSHWQALNFREKQSTVLCCFQTFPFYGSRSVWSNDCLNRLSICPLIAIPLTQMHEQWRNGGVETKMQRSDEKMWDLLLFYARRVTSGSPVCSCWEEREWTTALYRWLISRDIRIKESTEDLAGERQEGCLSPGGVLVCLHSAGNNVSQVRSRLHLGTYCWFRLHDPKSYLSSLAWSTCLPFYEMPWMNEEEMGC